MNPATIAALCTAIAGIIGAITALVTAFKAHTVANNTSQDLAVHQASLVQHPEPTPPLPQPPNTI